jgi:hypothetical protein
MEARTSGLRITPATNKTNPTTKRTTPRSAFEDKTAKPAKPRIIAKRKRITLII